MRPIELKTIFAAGFLCIAPVASLSNSAQNVFFGVEFLLVPITAKAACGGDIGLDFDQVRQWVSAFPDDAKEARIEGVLTRIEAALENGLDLEQALEMDLSEHQKKRLCRAALGLSLKGATAENLAKGDALTGRQQKAWQRFYKMVQRH